MFSSSRLMVFLCTLFVFFLHLSPTSLAFAWSLRFAPLHHPTGDDNALTPSTSVPVAPQFFRLLATSKQVVVGVEDAYTRAIELDPPIRFKVKPRPPAAAQPVANTRRTRPRHQLRGPEALLLRGTQTVVGNTLQ